MIDFQVPNEARSVLHIRDSPEEHVLETREYFTEICERDARNIIHFTKRISPMISRDLSLLFSKNKISLFVARV